MAVESLQEEREARTQETMITMLTCCYQFIFERLDTPKPMPVERH